MTRTINARLAGVVFLLYIATGIAAMTMFTRATAGDGTAARLASIARNESLVRATQVLGVLTIFYALALAVSLYALTRDCDPDLALLALSCRIGEGVINAIPIIATMGLVSLATAGAASDPATANAIATLLLKVRGWSESVGATIFAAGSTLYAYLFLRARTIPAPLAWLGLGASVLLVLALPAQLAGLLKGPAVYAVWLPMLVFEVALAFRLLVKGAS